MRNSNSPPSYQGPKQVQQTANPGPQYQRAFDPSGALSGAGFGQQIRNAGNIAGRTFDPAGVFRGNAFNPKGLIKEGIRSGLDPAGVFGGGDPKKVKGQIDPVTGTVTVGNYGKNNQALSDAFTNYLRTGDKGNLRHAGGAFEGLKKQIQALQGTGWKWGTPSAGAPTVIPGQGPMDWSQQPQVGQGNMNWGPQPGQSPTAGQSPIQRPPYQRPPQAPVTQNPNIARQYATAQALRPQQSRSALMGG